MWGRGWSNFSAVTTCSTTIPRRNAATGSRVRSGTTCSVRTVSVTRLIDLPSIDRILPHRYPLLLVDRIIEFEPNKRIVGIKHVSHGEPNLAKQRNGFFVIPPTIVM